jgi:hypothetical protein
MSKKTNLPIYRFKGDIIRKLKLSPDQNLRITFEDETGNGFEITDPQQIPTIEILEKRFPESESIKITAYFNDFPIKDEEILLHDEREEREEVAQPQDGNHIKAEYSFIQQVMKQQEILSEMKFKNFVEITNLKIDGMKSQFEEMMSQKEKIYQEKLEIEREKVKIESGLESEGLLYKALSSAIEELSPHLGDLAMTFISKYQNKNQDLYERKIQ